MQIEDVIKELEDMSTDILNKNKVFNSELRLLQLLRLVIDRRDEEIMPYASQIVLPLIKNKVLSK